MATPKEWQKQIEQVCARVGVRQLDLLLDQTDWNNRAVPALKMIRPQVPWFSLFSGTPEENLLDQAPLLMRLDLEQWKHRTWLEQLMTHCATDARLLVVISPLPFEVLSLALQGLLQMKWGGQAGVLRYYDPRIFPVLMNSILTDEQRAEYLKVVSYWGWLDRDEQPHWLQGSGQMYQDDIQVSPGLDLSDQQCDLIGSIGDAQRMLVGDNFEGLGASLESRFASLYTLVVQASQENYFGSLTEYVRKKL